MQYKTTIAVVTLADNEVEATDIAGEFLRGNITTGADLKVRTTSVQKSKKVRVGLVIFVGSLTVGAFILGSQVPYRFAHRSIKPVTSYAIQPPLKTNTNAQEGAEFKQLWEKEQKELINSKTR